MVATDSKEVLLQAIITSLRETPEEWRWTYPDHRFKITHQSGVELWVNQLFVGAPREIKFSGFWNMRRLRSAVKHWKRSKEDATRALDEANIAMVLRQFHGGSKAIRRVA